jgi:hypothetical protein
MIHFEVYYNMNNLKLKILILKMILHSTYMMQSTKTTTVTIHLVPLTVLSPQVGRWVGQ